VRLPIKYPPLREIKSRKAIAGDPIEKIFVLSGIRLHSQTQINNMKPYYLFVLTLFLSFTSLAQQTDAVQVDSTKLFFEKVEIEWKPAVQDGKKVKSYKKQPIVFMLVDDCKRKKE
jgi:hypothetical protein